MVFTLYNYVLHPWQMHVVELHVAQTNLTLMVTFEACMRPF